MCLFSRESESFYESSIASSVLYAGVSSTLFFRHQSEAAARLCPSGGSGRVVSHIS